MCTGWKAAQAHLRREGQSQDSNPETIFFSGFCWAFLVLLFILNIKGPFCCLLTFCNFTFRNVSLVTAFSEVHLSFQYLSLIVCLSFKIMYMNCKESEPIDCLSNWHQSVNLKFSGMFPFSIWVRIVFYVSFHEIYLTFPQKLLNCLVDAVVICVHFRKFFFLCLPGYLFLPHYQPVINFNVFSILGLQVIWSLSQMVKCVVIVQKQPEAICKNGQAMFQ